MARNVLRFQRARSGNYSMLMGLILLIVIGFGALSVDVSLITMAKLQAQAAADGASHAALVAYHKNRSTAEGTAAAQFIVNQDQVAMGYSKLASGSPEYGNWDFHAAVNAFMPGPDENGLFNAVRVKVERTSASGNAVDLLLAPMLGVPTMDVSATSITAQEMRALMMVNDLSCSMMYSPGTAIINSRNADLLFYEFLRDRPQAGDMLGLAMFAQKGTKNASAGAPWATLNPTDPPWIPLQLIKNNDAVFESGINGICNTMYATPCPPSGSDPHPEMWDIGGCTNPGIALNQAVHEITSKTSAPYFRGIVFMSDGLPNCGTAADAMAAADNAWTNDISVWSILFHNGSFDATFMQEMVRGIGFYQSSPDAAQLPEMYRQVAQSLPTAFVY
jgi:Flp pilus assembly protein TadG